MWEATTVFRVHLSGKQSDGADAAPQGVIDYLGCVTMPFIVFGLCVVGLCLVCVRNSIYGRWN